MTRLTSSQEEAVSYAGDAAIVSAPGSGKTLVLIEKVARLVEKEKVPLEKILLVTFTEKAAEELKARLAQRLGLPRPAVDRSWIGTIHSFFARILPPDFEVLEEPLANLQRLRLSREGILEGLRANEEPFLLFVRHFGLHASIRLASDLVRKKLPPDHPYARAIGRIQGRYAEEKLRKKRLDFQDLEEKGLDLLRQPPIQEKYSTLFQWLLVDEFQDTSPPQWEMLRLLHRPGRNRLVIVGDPRQSIYRFRGARPEIFSEATKKIQREGGQVFYLDENFRSTPPVIDFLNRLSPSLFPDKARPLIATRSPGVGTGIEILPVENSQGIEGLRQKEAIVVSTRIQRLREEGTPLREIALLFRTRLAMPYFEAELKKRETPFDTAGGEPLLERPEVITLILFWQHLLSPENRLPQLALGESPLMTLKEKSPLEKPLPEWTQDFFKRATPLMGPDPRVKRNIEEFQSWVNRLIQTGIERLPELIEGLQTLRLDEARIPSPHLEGGEGVRLLTVHAAKGLEFSVVFLCDLTGSPARARPPYLEKPQGGILFKEKDETVQGLKERLVKSTRFEELEAAELKEEEEEARRLLYVALSRARDRLILPLVEGKVRGGKNSWGTLLRGEGLLRVGAL